MSLGFDVVVVGAGSAGCVVASRLAADPARHVLLLEAGPNPLPVPSAALRNGWALPRGTDWPYDWGYTSEPDASGTTGPVRRGRVVGGTSWLTRFGVRGATEDFDDWARNGLRGWAFEDVLPFFRQVEADQEFGSAAWHGADGPVPIGRYPDLSRHSVHEAAVEAVVSSGFERIDDVNRPGAAGVGPMPMTSIGGRRVSAADAYLAPDRRPSNLEIRPDTQVANVRIDDGRATGVRLVDGSVVEAPSVILCGGTYGSAALLLRSGIGPATDLAALGMLVNVDLPGVGANLADHPGIEVATGWTGASPGEPILQSVAPWRSSQAASDEGPDMLFWFTDPQGDPAEFTIECVLMHPRARGRVRLQSADPADPPRISLPRMTERIDVERLAEGARRGAAIAARPELRAVCPEPAWIPPDTQEALETWVVENAYSIPHVVGTCAMGVSPSDGAVVDAEGRVHGVGGLRVVDASIIPEPPSGFPNLITMMVAERISSKAVETGSI